MKSILGAISILLFAVGCSVVDSTNEYEIGTRALQAGDYDTAIAHLEKSVQEEPTLPRHQSNLAAAYYAKGQYKEGWPHCCKAVSLSPHDPITRGNCLKNFHKMEQAGLVKKGDSETTILQNLGQPEKKVANGGIDFWQYGIMALRFQNGRYVGAGEIPLT